jgi:sugar/nucleoside kinase (ribokinase family)
VGASLKLRLPERAPYRALVGVGGIGSGIVFALEGDHDLGRNESRPGRLLEVRDYCKLHIVAHYPAVLLGAHPTGTPFRVVPVGKVGADDAGRRLRDEMAAAGMDVGFVDAVAGRPTLLSVCFQYPDGSGGNVTTSESAASALETGDVDRAAQLLGDRTIALAAPEVPLDLRLHLLRLASRHGGFRAAALTSAEMAEARARGLLGLVDLLALNEDEAAALAGLPFDARRPEPALAAVAAIMTSQQPSARVIVTAGRGGAYGFADGLWDRTPSLDVRVAATAGAGDALLGGVLTALAAGVPFTVPGPERRSLRDRPLASALDFGACVAACTVTSPHTIPPDFDLGALRAFADAHGLTFGDSLTALFPESA